MENFITILNDVQAEIIEKKSKFIANLVKVNSIEEAEEKIKEYKKRYYDARHNCIAYRVTERDSIVERSSDDGEPSGTAGAPMLNILQKNNLSNVLVIVTRYFGGVLLGTGGLVRAYSDVTLKAIEKAEQVEEISAIKANAILAYHYWESFQYYCKINGISIINVEYQENIVCIIALAESKKANLLEDFETKKINLKDLQFLSKTWIEKSIRK